MKKLLVAAASLAALLFASCSTPVVKANDQLDTPSVKAICTENGVIVLTWDKVADASSYSVQIKEPEHEQYKDAWGTQITYGSAVAYTIAANELDKEYSFKVQANYTGTDAKVNLLDSDWAEVSVTTPEAWVDSAAPKASEIALTKQNGTLNKYSISFPVKAGYKYDYKVVKATLDDAKVLYNSPLDSLPNAEGEEFAQVDGSRYEAIYKDVEENDETVSVLQASWIDAVTIPAPRANTDSADNESYYVVIKATPTNTEANQTTKYVVSSASAKYDWNEKTIPAPAAVNAVEIGPKKVRVSFTTDYINNKAVDASKYTVYYTLEQNVGSALNTIKETGDYVKVGSPAAVLAYDVVATASASAQKYSLDVDVNAYDAVKAYSYKFYVVADNGDTVAWSSASSALNIAATPQAYKDTTAPVIRNLDVTLPSSLETKADIEFTASKGASVKVYYGVFATRKAADNATAAEVATVLAATPVNVPTVTHTTTTTTVVDGVTTNILVETTPGTSSVSYKIAGLPLEVCKSSVNVTVNSADGKTTDILNSTTDAGKYYVLRVVASKAECDDVVETLKAYVTQNPVVSDITLPQTPATVVPTYRLNKTTNFTY